MLLSPMYGATKGADKLEKFINRFEKRQMILRKYLLLRQMVPLPWLDIGQDRSFFALIEEKIGHSVIKYHCIIHQESLRAKVPNSNFASVIATTTKIVNFIFIRSATTHRQFCSFLDEMESAHRDLRLHCTSRWLSCGKVLVRFVEYLDEIKIFLSNQGKH